MKKKRLIQFAFTIILTFSCLDILFASDYDFSDDGEWGDEMEQQEFSGAEELAPSHDSNISIYIEGLPENGIPYHPATGYEPRGNDDSYGRAVIEYFNRNLDPGNMSFKHDEIDLPQGQQYNLFFGTSKKQVTDEAGCNDDDLKAIIINSEKLKADARVFADTEGLKKLGDTTFSKIFENMPEEQIFQAFTEQTFYHELTHAIDEDKLKGQGAMTAEGYIDYFLDAKRKSEQKAYEAELYASKVPKYLLLSLVAKTNDPDVPVYYQEAAESITKRALDRLGYADYTADKAQEEKIRKRDFILTLSDEKINAVGGELYKEDFKQPPPSLDLIKSIPPEVFDNFNPEKK